MERPRRAERVRLQCEVEFKRHGDARYVVDLIDLSPTGCCLAPPIRIEPGESISLRIPEMEAIHGQVAWVRDWKAGVEFDRSFHPAVFDHVVKQLRGQSSNES